MWRAELAWRFPPRLRRWRRVLPLEAGSGQAPHSIAKLASERSRSGFSPAVTRSSPALAVPTPSSWSRSGASSSTSGAMKRSSSAISPSRSRIRRARDFQREPGRDRRIPVSRGVRPPSRADAQAPHAGEVADLVAQLVRRGDDRVVELLQGRPAALDRGLASRAQHPQGLHRAAAVLGHLDSTSHASRLGRRDRIECVVFSPGSSRGPVGTGHLEDGHSGQRQVPGNAGAVAAGGFDSHAQQLAVRPEPGKHRPVAGPCRGERFSAEHRAFERHDGGGVQILVGIDAPDDPGVLS